MLPNADVWFQEIDENRTRPNRTGNDMLVRGTTNRSCTRNARMPSSRGMCPSPTYTRDMILPQERCNVLSRLISCIIQCVPVVIQFDHFQYIDIDSYEVIKLLLTHIDEGRISTSKGLTIVTCYRDDTQSTLVTDFIERIHRTSIERRNFQHVKLTNMTWDNVREWVRDRLNNSTQASSSGYGDSITDFVFAHSKGLPLSAKYIWQLLPMMNNSNDSAIPQDEQHWDDEALERLRSDLPEKYDELFTLAVLRQDSLVQDVITTTAALLVTTRKGCLDASVLELVLQQSCSDALVAAHQLGLISLCTWRAGPARIRFTLPELHAAAYALIEESNRSLFHVRIGRRIWKYSTLGVGVDETSDDASLLYLVAQQLMLGDTNYFANHEERNTVAAIHLRAGRVAMMMSDFTSAASFFSFAINVLGSAEAWRNNDCYALTLELHNCCAEACYCIGDYTNMDLMVTSVLDHAISFRDKLQAYTVMVFANGARHRLQEALTTALYVLEELDEPIPTNPSQLHVTIAFLETRWMLRGKNDRFFLGLPAATAADKIAAMQMLNFTFNYAYVVNPNCAALAVCRLIRLALKYGISGPAITAFSGYGLMLCSGLGNTNDGFRYGQLALDLLDQLHAWQWLPRVYMPVFGHIRTLFHPLRESIDPLRMAYRLAMKSGDIEGSVLCAFIHTQLRFHAGAPLGQLERDARLFCEMFASLGQPLGLLFLVPLWESFHRLMGISDSALRLASDIANSDCVVRHAKAEGSKLAMCMYYTTRAVQSCLFGDYNDSWEMAKNAREAASYDDVGLRFYSSVAAIDVARNSKRRTRSQLLSYVRRVAREMKLSARTNPSNMTNKHTLLEAELAAMSGKSELALSLFETSIHAAKEEGFIQEEGLAYERLACHHRSLGRAHSAVPYFECARAAYSQWGANALIQHVEEQIRATTCAVSMMTTPSTNASG